MHLFFTTVHMTKSYQLLLMRHAHSPSAFGLGDHERVLDPLGRDQALTAAIWIKEKNFFPNRVLCSDAKRTQETCSVVFEYLGAAFTLILPTLYNSPMHAYADALLQYAQDAQKVMIIGHNPTCESFATYLTAEPMSFGPSDAVLLQSSQPWEKALQKPGQFARLLCFRAQ